MVDWSLLAARMDFTNKKNSAYQSNRMAHSKKTLKSFSFVETIHRSYCTTVSALLFRENYCVYSFYLYFVFNNLQDCSYQGEALNVPTAF